MDTFDFLKSQQSAARTAHGAGGGPPQRNYRSPERKIDIYQLSRHLVVTKDVMQRQSSANDNFHAVRRGTRTLRWFS